MSLPRLTFVTRDEELCRCIHLSFDIETWMEVGRGRWIEDASLLDRLIRACLPEVQTPCDDLVCADELRIAVSGMLN